MSLVVLRRFIDASDDSFNVRVSVRLGNQGVSRPVRAPPVFTDATEVWNAVQTVSTQREAKDRIRAASEEPF